MAEGKQAMIIEETLLSRVNQWVEERITEVSYLLAIFGFIVGTVDAFTGGSLMSITGVPLAWAVTQGVLIDGSFIIKGKRLAAAVRTRNWLAALCYFPLVVLLFVTAWAVTDIQSMVQMLALSPIAAMKELGLNPALTTHIRSGLVVFMALVIALENGIAHANKTMMTDQTIVSKGTRQSKSVKVKEVTPIKKGQALITGPVKKDQGVRGMWAKVVGSASTKIDQDTASNRGLFRQSASTNIDQADQSDTDQIDQGKPTKANKIDQAKLVQGTGQIDQSEWLIGQANRTRSATPEEAKVVDAYYRLMGRGEKTSGPRVAEEAGVSLNTAKKYLRTIKLATV